MLRLLLKSPWVKRAGHGIPIARLMLAAEVAVMAGRHLGRLDSKQRRRLLRLLVRARGRPRSLTGAERLELNLLVARLAPRVFFGTALRRLSPVPLPKRVLYGRRGSAARAALSRGG